MPTLDTIKMNAQPKLRAMMPKNVCITPPPMVHSVAAYIAGTQNGSMIQHIAPNITEATANSITFCVTFIIISDLHLDVELPVYSVYIVAYSMGKVKYLYYNIE
jgi:hypothetical protein